MLMPVRLLSCALGLVLALGLAGCGDSTAASAAPSGPKVPSVVGLSGTNAEATLVRAGYKVSFSSSSNADHTNPVTAQSPVAGVVADPATTTVVLSVTAPATFTTRAPVVSTSATVPPTTVPPTTVPPTSAGPRPLTSFGSGTYEVGTGDGQVPPGTYRTRGSEYCYWARLRGFDGELDSIIANGLPSGPTVLTIKASDKGIEVQGDCTFQKS